MGRTRNRPGFLSARVLPFDSKLPWEILGALPEEVQTAYGSLRTGLDLRAGQSLLIRGGTSTVGLTAAAVAKDLGATVVSTTRRPERAQMLRALGVDHPIVDDGDIAGTVQKSARTASTRHWNWSAPGICGTPCSRCASTAPSASPAPVGRVDFKDFSPLGYIPNGVRLTAYRRRGHRPASRSVSAPAPGHR